MSGTGCVPSADGATPQARLFRGLLIATLLSRVAAVLWFQTWTGDAGAYEHDLIARALVAGDGFRFPFFSDVAEPSGHQAPAIPMLLALGYALFGAGSAGGRLYVELFNAGLATIAAGAIGLLALRWWGRRVMAIAMVAFVLYPAFLYMPTRIQAVNWAMPFLLLGVLGFVALHDARDDPRAARRLAWMTGIVCGLGVLGEPILAAPYAFGWLWYFTRESAGRRTAVIVAAAAALTISPWVARNAIVLGELAFVKSSFWYVAWQGNHRGATGTDKLAVSPEVQRALAWRVGGGRELEALLDSARRQAVSVDAALTAADSAAIRALPNERARMQWFGTRLRAELRHEPLAYVETSARRLGMLLWFDPTNPRSFVLAYRLPYLLLAGMAIVGLVLIGRRGAPDGFSQWMAAASALMVVHTLIITSARFRLPLEALMVLPAALAVDAALSLFLPSAARGTPRMRG